MSDKQNLLVQSTYTRGPDPLKLVAIVTVQGEPEKAFTAPISVPARRIPGGLRGRVRIASDFDDASDEMTDLFEHSSV